MEEKNRPAKSKELAHIGQSEHSGHSSLHGSISLVDHDHMFVHVTLSCIKKCCATIERTANHTNVRRGYQTYIQCVKKIIELHFLT